MPVAALLALPLMAAVPAPPSLRARGARRDPAGGTLADVAVPRRPPRAALALWLWLCLPGRARARGRPSLVARPARRAGDAGERRPRHRPRPAPRLQPDRPPDDGGLERPGAGRRAPRHALRAPARGRAAAADPAAGRMGLPALRAVPGGLVGQPARGGVVVPRARRPARTGSEPRGRRPLRCSPPPSPYAPAPGRPARWRASPWRSMPPRWPGSSRRPRAAPSWSRSRTCLAGLGVACPRRRPCDAPAGAAGRAALPRGPA